jgi:hypothetical protein
MAIYDLYGFLSDDIDGAKNLLETSLGIHFEVRESDYQGGKYLRWGNTSDEHFVLKRNADPFDGEPSEMSFPAHRILFYVNDTSRSANLQRQINQRVKNLVLLRHEDLD